MSKVRPFLNAKLDVFGKVLMKEYVNVYIYIYVNIYIYYVYVVCNDSLKMVPRQS